MTNPADVLANLTRKLLKSRVRLNPSFRVALAKALLDYEQGATRFRILDLDGERPAPEGHRLCPECRRPFIPKRVNHVFCRVECRIIAGNKRNNPLRPKGTGSSITP